MSAVPFRFAELQRRTVANIDITVFGGTEGWKAPIAFIDAKTGFDEQVWCPTGTPDSILVWRVGGVADVRSEWGPSRGKVIASAARSRITLQPKGAPNHYRSKGAVQYRQFLITPQLLAHVSEELTGARASEAMLRDDLVSFDDAVLREHLDRYAERAPQGPTRLEAEARALLIIERLLTAHHGLAASPAPGFIDWRIRRAIEVMESDIGKDFGLAQLAEAADLSVSHFIRLFRTATGSSPHAYITRRRLERALARLAAPEASITEIALDLGFASSQHFATVFRGRFGVSPSQYRRERFA